MAPLSRTLLVVCPQGPVLRVFTCVARLRGWCLGRAENIPLAAAAQASGAPPDLLPEAIAAAVRPLVLRWGIAPGTEVALVLPPATGGLLSLADRSGSRGARARAAWLEAELAGRIPFALKDIEYETCLHTSGSERSIQVAWVPRSVAIEFRTAFARLGLALGEVVFRAQLYARHGRTPLERCELLIEHWAGWSCFHLIAGGRVLRSAMAPTPTAREFGDRLRLELLSIEDDAGAASPAASPGLAAPVPDGVPRGGVPRGGVPKGSVAIVVLAGAQGGISSEFDAAAKSAAQGMKIEQRTTDLSGMFVRFWRAGAKGIWLVPERPPPLAMARRLAYTMAGCGALLAAALTWDASVIGDETAALEARAASLRPQLRALVEKERLALLAIETVAAVARLSATPVQPQAALLAVFHALPRSAWVTGFTFEGDSATVQGKGMDTATAVARLRNQRGVRSAAAAPRDEANSAGGDSRQFQVRFQWVASEPEPQPALHGAREKRPR